MNQPAIAPIRAPHRFNDRRITAVKRLMVLVSVSPLMFGCTAMNSSAQSDQRMPLQADEEGMRAEVLKHISPGMPVDEARIVMEKNGFDCHYGRPSGKDRSVSTQRPADDCFCLICSRTKPQPSWFTSLFMSEDIFVYVTFDKGIVSDVRVGIARCCL
jgi:hypothetical protein